MSTMILVVILIVLGLAALVLWCVDTTILFYDLE
jgi:hypothetical protein